MQLVKSNVELIEPDYKLPEGVNFLFDSETSAYVDANMKFAEVCGRVAYQSEHKIKPGSYVDFHTMITRIKHWSVFEHETYYLKIPKSDYSFRAGVEKLKSNQYTVYNEDDENYYFTTNYRALLESEKTQATRYTVPYDSSFVRRLTFRIVCSRGISHELVRHRAFSFTQESTRYCNYTKDKFGNCITFVIPYWAETLCEGDTFTRLEELKTLDTNTAVLINSFLQSEQMYQLMIIGGHTAQEARDVLPNGLKTELVMTGTTDQWCSFLKLRSSKAGAKGMHPDMDIIANKIYDALNN